MSRGRWARGLRASIALGACLSAGLIAAACGDEESGGATSSAARSAEDIRIAFFHFALSDNYQQTYADTAREEAARLGVELDLFSADFDTNKQLNQVQDAVSSGKYQGIVLQPMDSEALCKPLVDAAEQGIAVAIFSTPICGDFESLYTPPTVGYFGRDEHRSGVLMVQAISEALDGAGKIGYVTGPAQNATVRWLGGGIEAELANHPDIQLVAQLDGEWNVAKGLAATEDLLQAHPEVDGIMYGADSMANSSIPSIQKAGGGADTVVVGFGWSTKAQRNMQQGLMHANVPNLLREESAYAIKAVVQTLQGKDVSVPAWDAERKVYDEFEDPKLKGAPVITEANMSEVDPEWTD